MLRLMAVPARVNYTVVQGDQWTLDVTINDENGSPRDLSGNTFASQVRAEEDPTSELLLDWVVDDSDAGNGVISLSAAAAVTETIPQGDYWWDLETQGEGDYVQTILRGVIQVKADITRA